MRRKSKTNLFLIIYFSCSAFFLSFSHAQAQGPSKEEEQVLGTLDRFKAGIEQGNLEIGRQITTGDFYPLFKSFYESLANIYSQHKASLPMEIGHLKILKSGPAKVEVYLNPARNLFVFTLKKEDGFWKISHLEGIRFPLYSVPDLPYRSIYEIPGDQRKFMIAETELNFMTRVFFYLKEQIGEECAKNFFLDGPGYKVAMEAWLPFLEGAAQFAFFFVIIESNFFGSLCEVTRADEREAEVRCLKLAALEVLKRGYAVPKFSYEEYTALLRAIIKHRAEHCGLEIEMSFKDTGCLIKIRRQ